MLRSILASAALIAAAHAAGDAIVINSCSYDVYLANTPAMGGGFSAINQVLSPGGTYSQTYTQLTNGNGWSLKLSKTANAFMDNILQYEYTFHNDGTIWYDLSEVNGNPWDGNWEITATDGCSPRQAAYRYATDDAYGMQSCAEDASITVTLCSGDSGSSWGSTSPLSASPVNKHHGHGHKSATSWALDANKVAAPAGDAVLGGQSSTLATVYPSAASAAPAAESSEAWNGPAVTVTNLHIETLTEYVTAAAATPAAKRHAHHARHAHHHRL